MFGSTSKPPPPPPEVLLVDTEKSMTLAEKHLAKSLYDEVYQSIKEILIEALACDNDEVFEGATLVGDLGAESIDFLNIVFNLEQKFNIEIDRNELFPEDIFTNEGYARGGVLNEMGLTALRDRMPFMDFSTFSNDPRIAVLGNLMTVGDLCKFVVNKTSS